MRDFSVSSSSYSFRFIAQKRVRGKWTLSDVQCFNVDFSGYYGHMNSFVEYLCRNYRHLNDSHISQMSLSSASKRGSISLNDALEKIAKDCMGVETLETRNSDSLDFVECSVWGIKSALERAYKLGSESKGKLK